MIDLSNYKNNKYSQNGEDGILEEILRILDIKNGTFVEFGAADGKLLSNTWNLLERGWSGLYIEGVEDRYNQCLENIKNHQNIKCVNKYVDFEGQDTLDNILSDNSIISNFDVLSIDIDGYDYKVWESFNKFKPKVVIIEINSAIEPGHYQTHEPPDKILTSFSSMVDLGISKGYTPVCHTGNLIFIDKDLEFPEVNFYFLRNWIGIFSNPFNLT